MKIAVIIIALLVAVAALGFAGLVLYGKVIGWDSAARPADQGIYDFERARRSPSGNDALACTEGRCADPDLLLPVPPADPAAAYAQLEPRIADDAAMVERVDDGTDPAYRRYLVRTPLFRFPDTVDIRWSPEGWRAMSRSLIGRGDLAANVARLRRWFGLADG